MRIIEFLLIAALGFAIYLVYVDREGTIMLPEVVVPMHGLPPRRRVGRCVERCVLFNHKFTSKIKALGVAYCFIRVSRRDPNLNGVTAAPL
ncbi:MAG: hypothetical protein WA717_13895, partial [Methyloceanibacter sp.]